MWSKTPNMVAVTDNTTVRRFETIHNKNVLCFPERRMPLEICYSSLPESNTKRCQEI